MHDIFDTFSTSTALLVFVSYFFFLITHIPQDLAVVPLLVAIPLLAGGGGGLAAALTSAATKAAIALGLIAFIGERENTGSFREGGKELARERLSNANTPYDTLGYG